MKLPAIEGKTVAVLICFVMLYFVRSHIVFNENPERFIGGMTLPS